MSRRFTWIWVASAFLVNQVFVEVEAAENNKRVFPPEERSQIFVNALINGDYAGLSQLSTTPTDKEEFAKYQNYLNSMAERSALKEAMENLVNFTKAAITKTPRLSDDLHKQLVPFARAQVRAIRKVECRVTGSKTLDVCWQGESQRVEVYLSCQVPEIPSWTPLAVGQQLLPETYFSALSNAWEGAASKSLPVKMRFYATEEDEGWEMDTSHDPRGVIAAISASMSPETASVKTNKYIPGATSMTLNHCIYRHSSDFNNRHVLRYGSFWRFATLADLDQVLTMFGDAYLLVYDGFSETTAFHVALENKASLPVMQALRNQLPHMPGLGGVHGPSLLTKAIKAHNSAETIKWLIDEGAPVDELREPYMRPLIYAVMEGADAQTIDLLVASGADLSYYNNTSYPDLDALSAALRTESQDARRAITRHLILPESGSDLMQYLLSQLSYQRYRPGYPDGVSDILPILIERGMSLDETFCNFSVRYSCEPDQRSNLMDLAVHIGSSKLIDFFEQKGLKPNLI
ncbi:ankyrin repeat domain-containing protein [Pseudomonas alkylphenolica]|nr:ankyrin repeat domain-containing protein [Pseudomonas alkylphenolica]